MNPFAALSGRSVSSGSSVDFQAAILAPGKLLNFDGSSPNGEADIFSFLRGGKVAGFVIEKMPATKSGTFLAAANRHDGIAA